MSHVKQKVRDAIVTALTGLATTGANVFRSHVYPLTNKQLPGICVYTLTEDLEYLTVGPSRRISRTITVGVDIYVRMVTGYDNELDTIQAEVETAIANLSFQGIKYMTIGGINTEMSNEGDMPLARTSVAVTVICDTIEGNSTDFA